MGDLYRGSSGDRRLSSDQKSMLDVSCGGSKLTPIVRSFSQSSILPPTTPSEKRRRSNEQAPVSQPPTLRCMPSLTDGSPFFAPQVCEHEGFACVFILIINGSNNFFFHQFTLCI
jgi:hypothetical protein